MKQPKSIHSLLVNSEVTATWKKNPKKPNKHPDVRRVRKCLGNRVGRDKIKCENSEFSDGQGTPLKKENGIDFSRMIS